MVQDGSREWENNRKGGMESCQTVKEGVPLYCLDKVGPGLQWDVSWGMVRELEFGPGLLCCRTHL